MSEVKLLPLPEGVAIGWSQAWSHDQMRDYARANMEPLLAENERLRAEVAEYANTVQGYIDTIAEADAQAERLAGALRDAASSLEVVATESGRDKYLADLADVRGYSHSRAKAARAALDQEGGNG